MMRHLKQLGCALTLLMAAMLPTTGAHAADDTKVLNIYNW